MLNYYELLKLPESLTHEEIELAFKSFKYELQKFSPGIKISDAELRLRQPDIWDAYVVLLDPVKRKEHDEMIERDRIHIEYERMHKLVPSEGELNSSNKAKLIFLVAMAFLLVLYFIIPKLFEKPYKPVKWHTHYITDDVKVLLPASIDTTQNTDPPFLQAYIKGGLSYKSELSNGFCVSISLIEMREDFKIPFKDLAYITGIEEQSPKIRNRKCSEIINTTLKDYRVSIARGTYQYENIIRASDNFTLLNGTTGIKVIVNYNPGDEQQVKYAEIIFNSLKCF